jgi:phage/plasmid-associated DNA primase
MRAESNPARRYLQEHYRTGAGELRTADLYAHYSQWCKDTGHHPLAETGFGREVARVFKQVKRGKSVADHNGKRHNTYQGIAHRVET